MKDEVSFEVLFVCLDSLRAIKEEVLDMLEKLEAFVDLERLDCARLAFLWVAFDACKLEALATENRVLFELTLEETMAVLLEV